MKRRESGFTLIEILIVIAIIGIVAALAAPVYFRYIYTQELAQSQQILIQQINAARGGSKKNSQNYWIEWQNGAQGGDISVVRKFATGPINPAIDTVKTLKLGSRVTLASTGTAAVSVVTATAGFDSRISYAAPYGRSGVNNVEFKLSHANLPGLFYTVRVMGVTGKVVRVEKF